MKRSPAQTEAEWTIEALLDARPEAAGVLLRRGMACVGCAMAPFETLAEVAAEYRADLHTILAELQRMSARKRRRSNHDLAQSRKPMSKRRA